jgi:hypothetical protein
MKLFKITTKVTNPTRMDSEFVDWYEADAEPQALELYREDLHRYGVPADKSSFVCVECNPITLKPVN